MPNGADVWEHGSEFHWLDFEPVAAPLRNPWDEHARFFGSGRDALSHLLGWGSRKRDWRRIWIPSYYCQEVVAAILATGLEVVLYPDDPLHRPSPQLDMVFARGDVLLLVNHFGLRRPADLKQLDRRIVEVIEDHTHDPWSDWALGSEADFAMASLRKTLPVPDGGVFWSPCGKDLPEPCAVSGVRRQASRSKLSGMLLKALYLQGHDVAKEQYRRLLAAGESAIAADKPSGMTEESRSLLRLFPIDRWRAIRRDNHRYLAERLAPAEGVRVLTGSRSEACPFSTVLLFHSENHRNLVRRQLLKEHIYPAILWSMENASRSPLQASDRRLSAQLLSLHCDMRYRKSDLDRVGRAVIRANDRCRDATDSGLLPDSADRSILDDAPEVKHETPAIFR